MKRFGICTKLPTNPRWSQVDGHHQVLVEDTPQELTAMFGSEVQTDNAGFGIPGDRLVDAQGLRQAGIQPAEPQNIFATNKESNGRLWMRDCNRCSKLDNDNWLEMGKFGANRGHLYACQCLHRSTAWATDERSLSDPCAT